MKRDKRMSRLALGFDETNNGFSIPHAPFMIMTGVLGPDGRGYGTMPYGSKSNRGFFGKRDVSRDEILTCARNYLNQRNDFKYTVIPMPEKYGSATINHMKAKAISSIALNFIDSGSVPEDTPIYIHQIDGYRESQFVEESVRNILNYAGISKPNVQVLKTLKNREMKEVIKDADITGYYIAAIKFLLSPRRWPFKDKRVPFKTLDDLIIDRKCRDLWE